MEGLPSDVVAEKSKWFTKGFNTSFAFNINEYFGIQAGVMNNRSDVISARSASENTSMKMAITDFAFMAGPRFTLRKSDVITPFAHVLFGVDQLKVKQTEQFGNQTESFEDSKNGFGLAFGGGLDLTVHRNVAILGGTRCVYTVHRCETGKQQSSEDCGSVIRRWQ
ncbi:MAG TPA: outer membrane beta-barrel protein [Acidobacteriota bacterium]|nr:outer membrane beta-barrel protein [Acidobacteriota bacterium]